MKRTKKDRFSLAKRGEVAFRGTVAKVVKQHREAGVPLIVWSKGNIALGAAKQGTISQENN